MLGGCFASACEPRVSRVSVCDCLGGGLGGAVPSEHDIRSALAAVMKLKLTVSFA